MQDQRRQTTKTGEWTILKLLNWATSYFTSHTIDSPRSTAEILLAHALKLRRIELYLRFDQPLCNNELAVFKGLIKRRINSEPVAYIVGEKEFWSLAFFVTKDVLIPRPDTECLVESAISLVPKDSGTKRERILELGTGSGAIIISLASGCPGHLYFASDRSLKAIEVAKDNAKRHNLQRVIHFFSGDWFGPLKNKLELFDLILTNPPYIPTADIEKLQPEIYKQEPLTALDGGEDGLAAIKQIITEAGPFLKEKGCLLLEIGYDQKNRIEKIIDACGHYENVIFKKDYSGHYRVVQMQKKRDKMGT